MLKLKIAQGSSIKGSIFIIFQTHKETKRTDLNQNPTTSNRRSDLIPHCLRYRDCVLRVMKYRKDNESIGMKITSLRVERINTRRREKQIDPSLCCAP